MFADQMPLSQHSMQDVSASPPSTPLAYRRSPRIFRRNTESSDSSSLPHVPSAFATPASSIPRPSPKGHIRSATVHIPLTSSPLAHISITSRSSPNLQSPTMGTRGLMLGLNIGTTSLRKATAFDHNPSTSPTPSRKRNPSASPS